MKTLLNPLLSVLLLAAFSHAQTFPRDSYPLWIIAGGRTNLVNVLTLNGASSVSYTNLARGGRHLTLTITGTGGGSSGVQTGDVYSVLSGYPYSLTNHTHASLYDVLGSAAAVSNWTVGALAGKSDTNHNHSTLYYPLSSNPSNWITSAALSGYATESYVNGRGFLTNLTSSWSQPLLVTTQLVVSGFGSANVNQTYFIKNTGGGLPFTRGTWTNAVNTVELGWYVVLSPADTNIYISIVKPGVNKWYANTNLVDGLLDSASWVTAANGSDPVGTAEVQFITNQVAVAIDITPINSNGIYQLQFLVSTNSGAAVTNVNTVVTDGNYASLGIASAASLLSLMSTNYNQPWVIGSGGVVSNAPLGLLCSGFTKANGILTPVLRTDAPTNGVLMSTNGVPVFAVPTAANIAAWGGNTNSAASDPSLVFTNMAGQAPYASITLSWTNSGDVRITGSGILNTTNVAVNAGFCVFNSDSGSNYAAQSVYFSGSTTVNSWENKFLGVNFTPVLFTSSQPTSFEMGVNLNRANATKDIYYHSFNTTTTPTGRRVHGGANYYGTGVVNSVTITITAGSMTGGVWEVRSR